jgi:phosphoglycolate phosphatase
MKRINLLDYQLIIFDLDGTLVDTAPDIVGAVKYIIEYFDAPKRTDEEIAGFIGGGARKVLLRSLGPLKEHCIEDALILFKEHYIQHCTEQSTVYDGVVELLEYLKQHGKQMAICTMKIRSATIKILQEKALLPYFTYLVTADEIKQPKPDPEGINLVLQAIECPASQAIIIGDTTQDIMAAHNAGIDSIAVSYGYESVDLVKMAKPDLIIESLSVLTNPSNKY